MWSWAASVSRVVRFCCACGVSVPACAWESVARVDSILLCIVVRRCLSSVEDCWMKPWIWEIVEGSTPRRVARSATKLPYSRVTSPPCVETNWPLSSIRLTNRCCAPSIAVATRVLNLWRGERRLRHVRGELSGRRRDRSGERLSGGRQLLLDLGLHVDVGVELVDREDAELLLDVLVLEDLLGAVGEFAAVEDLGLNPVRDHRDDQHDRREHDEGPHELAVTMLRLGSLGGLSRLGGGVVHWLRPGIGRDSLRRPGACIARMG